MSILGNAARIILNSLFNSATEQPVSTIDYSYPSNPYPWATYYDRDPWQTYPEDQNKTWTSEDIGSKDAEARERYNARNDYLGGEELAQLVNERDSIYLSSGCDLGDYGPLYSSDGLYEIEVKIGDIRRTIEFDRTHPGVLSYRAGEERTNLGFTHDPSQDTPEQKEALEFEEKRMHYQGTKDTALYELSDAKSEDHRKYLQGKVDSSDQQLQEHLNSRQDSNQSIGIDNNSMPSSGLG